MLPAKTLLSVFMPSPAGDVTCRVIPEGSSAHATQANVRTPAARTGWKRCDDLGHQLPDYMPAAERSAVRTIKEDKVLSEGHNVAMLLYERVPR